MALTATNTINSIVIEENGLVILQLARRAFDDDGTLIGERLQRTILEPGNDVSSQAQRVQRICQVVWTQAVIDAYQAAKAARGTP